MDRILVTGGAGYLGSHVVNILGSRAIVYDRLLYTDEYLKDTEFVRANVADYPLLQQYLDRVDCVIWLAAIVGDPGCKVQPEMAVETNDRAVRYLAEHFNGKIIFTSSCSAYGANTTPADETASLNPLSLYAETKINAERYLANKNALILRLGTLHGISDRMRFDLVVNVLTLRAMTTKQIEIYGGSQWRPLLGVREAAEFIARQVDQEYSPGIYNLASENLRIVDVAHRVKAQIPDVTVDLLGAQYEDNRNYKISIEKARKQLGFEPMPDSVDRSIGDIKRLLESGRLKYPGSAKYVNVVSLQQEFGP